MKITESRSNDILRWLDDETGNHALLFEKMTLHRDAAALIRQLQAELQDAWHAGLDAGREQGSGNEHCRAERLAEALRLIESAKDRGFGIDYARGAAKSALRAHDQQPAVVGSAEAGITPLPQPPAAQTRA